MKEKDLVLLVERSFKKIDDFNFKEINFDNGCNVYIAYLRTMVNKVLLTTSIMEPLQKIKEKIVSLEQIAQELTVAGSEIVNEKNKIFNNILSGQVVIFLKNEQKALCCPCVGYEKRSIQEPPTSAVLKGPREGFTEDLDTNLSLIRKRLRTNELKCETFVAGKYTNTNIAVLYINTIVDKKIVKQITNKIKKIDIDGIIDSYYIQAVLEEKHSNIFKQVGNSEKPDITVAKMLEGRVAIIVEGSPLVLTLPYLLFEDFQSSDDYYMQPVKATMSRLIRVIGIMIAVGLPGLYVAFESFHYALLPLDFLISLQSSLKVISFPPLIEILFVIFLFEILNEASIRMPKYLGMALSIVGALVLGDTAVKAGLISSPAVIIVAISGITHYTVPDQVNTASVLRVLFSLVGGVAGFYGLIMCFIATIAYLMTFNSYGTPYFAPYAPMIEEDKKDAIFKLGLLKMKTRPKSISNKNIVRQRNAERDK